jgi:preprotein translocase subunit SecE
MMAKEKEKSEGARGPRRSRTESNLITRYFQELKMEWKKITFPERKELYRSTVVVFIFTLVVTAIISLFDALVTQVFSFILPV